MFIFMPFMLIIAFVMFIISGIILKENLPPLMNEYVIPSFKNKFNLE